LVEYSNITSSVSSNDGIVTQTEILKCATEEKVSGTEAKDDVPLNVAAGQALDAVVGAKNKSACAFVTSS
jgi:hypothetical protein